MMSKPFYEILMGGRKPPTKAANFEERLAKQKRLFEELRGPDVGYYFTPDMLEKIKNVTLSNDDKQTKTDRIREIISIKDQLEYYSTGLNRVVYRDKGLNVLVKIPFDKSGIDDAMNELRNQEILKPFCAKIFSAHASGLCSVHECVIPYTAKSVFNSEAARDVLMMIEKFDAAGYILADSGSDAFKNYGQRVHSDPDMNGMIVTLDFPFLTKRTVYVCNVCGHKIRSNLGHNTWRCEHCHTEYDPSAISRPITDEEILKFNPKSNLYKEEEGIMKEIDARQLKKTMDDLGPCINIGGRMVPLKYVGKTEEEIKEMKKAEARGFGSYDAVPRAKALSEEAAKALSMNTVPPILDQPVVTEKRIPDGNTYMERQLRKEERRNQNRFNGRNKQHHNNGANGERKFDKRNDRKSPTQNYVKSSEKATPIETKAQETVVAAQQFATMQLMNHGAKPEDRPNVREDEYAQSVYVDTEDAAASDNTIANLFKGINLATTNTSEGEDTTEPEEENNPVEETVETEEPPVEEEEPPVEPADEDEPANEEPEPDNLDPDLVFVDEGYGYNGF